MKKNINKYDFIREFDHYNRSDNFSVEGREALFDYLEEIDEDLVIDVIAICCDFSEYSNLAEFQSDYGEGYESIEDIEDCTTVIRINEDSFIIQQF